MKRLQPVIWTKVTFLSPQHLQLQDRFLEDLLQFHLDSLSFRPWGFRSLQIGREALAAGSLAISSASGIFPDGLLFDIPGSDSAPPPKLLADCLEPDQTTLDIYLSVPQYRDRGLNVATAARQGGARYRAEVELFRDENTGLSEKPLQIARKNLRLLLQPARGARPPHRSRRFSGRSAVCSAPAQFPCERLPLRHRPSTGGDPHRPLRRLRRSAPAEESEPRRFHRRRYRQLLAALHRQHGLPPLPPPV